MCDENGILEGRERPWGSLNDVFFSDVNWLYFYPTTRRLRFFQEARVGLAQPWISRQIPICPILPQTK